MRIGNVTSAHNPNSGAASVATTKGENSCPRYAPSSGNKQAATSMPSRTRTGKHWMPLAGSRLKKKSDLTSHMLHIGLCKRQHRSTTPRHIPTAVGLAPGRALKSSKHVNMCARLADANSRAGDCQVTSHPNASSLSTFLGIPALSSSSSRRDKRSRAKSGIV